jgi:hypothetical protein
MLLTACVGAETDKPAASNSEPDKPATAAEPEPDATTDGEPDKPAALEAEAQCVMTCVETNVMTAKPADVIEADCRAKCSDGAG